MTRTIDKNAFRYAGNDELKSLLHNVNCACGIKNIRLRLTDVNDWQCIYDDFFGLSYETILHGMIEEHSYDWQQEVLIAICEYVFSLDFKQTF